MCEAVIGMNVSLLPGIFSEQMLHGFTFLGILSTMLGFLYLSYELLGKPRGIFNWVLILFTHLVVSIWGLAVFAPPMLFLFAQVLREIHIPSNIVDPVTQIGDMIVYTLMIAALQGTLVAFPPPTGAIKRWQWRDCLIGFLFALVFFSIDEYAIFQTPINDVIDVIPDVVLFLLMGAVGAGFWRRYGQRSHSLAALSKEGETIHRLFSFSDFIRGLLFWYIVVGLSTMVWIVLYIRWYGLTKDILFYLVDLFVGAAPASLICGSSLYITWKVGRLGERQLGMIGAGLSLIGFLLSLIEPLVLFLATPGSHGG
ncbi:hypothetical protein KSF_089950 [Reticulibacter mediterranei]|uniref:Uncharacterized protein n=1 Tax=Reticulibacter mediterranei TaxID=2778369 RepID=A0A8J3N564_9CHLR|nr:hypothetical protein [Reticulibacter mediterranei]GHO98947.1 hypothetical protein KSF_089950 [Reticulibacter mediterranei]